MTDMMRRTELAIRKIGSALPQKDVERCHWKWRMKNLRITKGNGENKTDENVSKYGVDIDLG